MRPPFGRHWLVLSVPTWLVLFALHLLGVFDTWAWWQTWGLYIAVGYLVSEAADHLAAHAASRSSTDRETPP